MHPLILQRSEKVIQRRKRSHAYATQRCVILRSVSRRAGYLRAKHATRLVSARFPPRVFAEQTKIVALKGEESARETLPLVRGRGDFSKGIPGDQ